MSRDKEETREAAAAKTGKSFPEGFSHGKFYRKVPETRGSGARETEKDEMKIK